LKPNFLLLDPGLSTLNCAGSFTLFWNRVEFIMGLF